MRKATLAHLGIILAVLTAGGCGSTPASTGAPQPTYESANVGLYTGGWHGGPLDAGTSPDGDEGEGEPEAGLCEPGTACGRVTTTSTYCGGPAPSEEMLQDLATPRAAGGIALVASPGEAFDPYVPVTAGVTTDDQGRFSFAAEPGVYCLVVAAKADFLTDPLDVPGGAAADGPAFGVADPACMDQWARTCDAVVTVSDTSYEAQTFNIAHGCSENPCIPWIPRP